MILTDTTNHPSNSGKPFASHWPQWLWLGLLLLGVTPALRADIVEQEPNDSRDVATPIVIDSSNHARVSVAKIATLTDVDYYKISVPVAPIPRKLTFTMTPTSGDHDLDAKLELESANGPLTSRGTVVATQDQNGDNGAETLSVTLDSGSTYYLRCTSADFFSSGSGDYTLTIDVADPEGFLSAYWVPPRQVVEGTVVTLRAELTGFAVGELISFEIREDHGLLGYDTVATVQGTVYTNTSNGGLFADAAWPALWISDGGRDPKYSFVAYRDDASLESGSDDAVLMHVSRNDRDDQITEAIPFGPLTQTRSLVGEISATDDVDLYSFTVTDGQRIAFNANGGVTPYLRVFDSAGNELAHAAGGLRTNDVLQAEADLEQVFPVGGTYYVGVSGVGNEAYDAVGGQGDTAGSTGSYTLVVSPGIAGTIQRPGDTTEYPVDILRFGPNPGPIDPNVRTWIVIHGWRSSRTNQNIAEATASLAQVRPDDQVLTLDWRAAADTSVLDPFDAEASIVPVAKWAASALAAYGFHGTNLNLVGHSFGSYVADQLAENLGGVDTIVALDAAENIPGGFDPEDPAQVNFARDSLFSWSFHTSVLGSAESPVTADEAFVVEGDQVDPIDAHGDAVFLFNYLLLHPTDLVGQYFLLPRLLAGIVGPWLANQYATHFTGETETGGYEAEITTTGSGDALVANGISFVPGPAQIAVFGGDLTIINGDTTPSAADGTDFGSTLQGRPGPTRTYTVRNDGGSPLTLGLLSLPAGFELLGQFPTNVAPGSSTNFTVALDTTTPGIFSGPVRLTNNLADGNPFSFALTGTIQPLVVQVPELRLTAAPVLTLQVDGIAGATYTVEFSELLGDDAQWQPVRTLATGESWTPPADTAQGFFRVRVP